MKYHSSHFGEKGGRQYILHLIAYIRWMIQSLIGEELIGL
jgi:hypothetical protein